MHVWRCTSIAERLLSVYLSFSHLNMLLNSIDGITTISGPARGPQSEEGHHRRQVRALGGVFAMASEDGRVYIHDAADYALRTVCTKMPTAIKTLDWSLDSK